MKPSPLATRIRTLRAALDLTQEGLARLIGVSFTTVNHWENGAASPRGHAELLLESLAKVVAAGRQDLLLAELESGVIAAGTATAYHRIFSLALGFKMGAADRQSKSEVAEPARSASRSR